MITVLEFELFVSISFQQILCLQVSTVIVESFQQQVSTISVVFCYVQKQIELQTYITREIPAFGGISHALRESGASGATFGRLRRR